MLHSANFVLCKVWSSGSFTPTGTSRTLSETDKFDYQRSSEESAASTGSRSLDARCFGNVFEQFAQSSLAVEPDDEDAEDEDVSEIEEDFGGFRSFFLLTLVFFTADLDLNL